MGFVVVISLPLILFALLLGFGCYFLGRARGRRELLATAQVHVLPTPPPGATTNQQLGGPPPPAMMKCDNSMNV
ncbi:uncharacterized protein LOC116267722 [Nymphaea colorata]|nr:uncharacterized protein LOC116267722 [Nymphaea colorata]